MLSKHSFNCSYYCSYLAVRSLSSFNFISGVIRILLLHTLLLEIECSHLTPRHLALVYVFPESSVSPAICMSLISGPPSSELDPSLFFPGRSFSLPGFKSFLLPGFPLILPLCPAPPSFNTYPQSNWPLGGKSRCLPHPVLHHSQPPSCSRSASSLKSSASHRPFCCSSPGDSSTYM